jgi:hypothetical protein
MALWDRNRQQQLAYAEPDPEETSALGGAGSPYDSAAVQAPPITLDEGVGNSQPALQPQQQPAPQQGAPPQIGTGEGDVDPEIGRKVAKQSKEAVDKASKATKKQINDELVGTFGQDGLEKAYEEAIERLGGEKTVDLSMKKEDWGLFLMDFGMRLAAASGSWDSQLGSAMGEAGGGALGGVAARQQGALDEASAYNKEMRGTAMDIAKHRMGQGDQKNIMWTEKGMYNVVTGKYQRDPEDGSIIQQGADADGGPYSKEVSAKQLELAGIRPDIAKQVAHGGSPTPAEVRLGFIEDFDKRYGDSPSILLKFPGTNIKVRGATPEEYDKQRDLYMKKGVEAVYGPAPALEPYGSAGRPGNF